jgi:hypothetical protein
LDGGSYLLSGSSSQIAYLAQITETTVDGFRELMVRPMTIGLRLALKIMRHETDSIKAAGLDRSHWVDDKWFGYQNLNLFSQDEMLARIPQDAMTRRHEEIVDGELRDYSLDDLKRDMGYCSLTFWGFISWLGNILPPNEATIELVMESMPLLQTEGLPK